MKVYSVGSSVFADKLEPNYYYGGKTDSIWTVKLIPIQVQYFESFLKQSKQLKGKCPLYLPWFTTIG